MGRRTIKLYDRFVVRLTACLVAICCLTTLANASEFSIFRIGSGGIGGTYYPISYLLASTFSQPPGSRPCDEGGACGVEGVIGVPQSSNGSVVNVQSVHEGKLESALTQSDIAYWGFTASGVFEGENKLKNLRAIASLYSEMIHVVVRKDSGISSIEDLAGKRVSLDEPGSGTLVNARLILNAYGLSESDLQAEYIKPRHAIEKMRVKDLDAFFIVVGYPAKAITELTESTDIKLIPIVGEGRHRLVRQFRFFQADTIPEATYRGVDAVETLSVTAIWVTSSEVDDELVYGIVKSLWNDPSRKLLDEGHKQGKSIQLVTALGALDIPLHPGAERFYLERNMILPVEQGR
ncbi:MAG: TAXI family TRAP transporter solute-binding subunit [Pseudomonadota bacterium]